MIGKNCRRRLMAIGLTAAMAVFCGCAAETTRQKVSLPPLAESPTPQTIFGEATLDGKGRPDDIHAPLLEPGKALNLDECLELAIKVSPGLDNADQAYVGAMWDRWKSITAFLPTASASYGVTRFDEEQTSLLQRAGDTRFAKSVSITQPLFTGFQNTSNLLLSRLGVSAADIQRTQAKNELTLLVKQAYFGILANQKALRVAKQTVTNLRSHKKVAQNFYDVGMIPQNQVLAAEVKLAEAIQSETELTHDLIVAKSQLNVLLRQDLSFDIKVVDALTYKPFPLKLEECLAIGLEEKPEMQLGRKQVEMAGHRITTAKSGYYPQVNLVYANQSFGDNMRAHGGWLGDASSWSVAATANWNFWEWGRTKADVEKSKVGLNRAVNDLTSLEDNTKLEITSNYQKLLSTGKNINVSAKAVAAANEDLRMVTERYTEQVATSTEVLDAQTRYSEAQYRHYQALYSYNLAWASLERAIGRQVR